MYQKIVVPLDGSMRAEAILPHVEELAHRFGSQVILVRVVELSPPIGAVERAYSILRQRDLNQQIREAEAYLSAMQGEFREKGIAVRTRVAYGPVVSAIVHTADDEQADLIAIASHGHSGLSQVFYGSVAAGLLNRVDRPLLLVRSRESA
jgi:nucleotide-binding universal stress UspA family protein